MQEIELLQQKLNQLIKQYIALQADHRSLSKQLTQQQGQLQEQAQQIALLEQKLKFTSVVQSAGVVAEEQKEQLKTQLCHLIQEIDRNIELLS
jgi:hypothetical protein